MLILANPYRTAAALVLASILVCSGILLERHARQNRIKQSIRTAEVRQALERQRGITSDRLDNLFANADQYLWIQHGMVHKVVHIPVRVDPSVNRILFLIRADASDCRVSLRQPGDRPLDTTSGNVYQPRVAYEYVTEIKRPISGDWTIDIKAHDQVQVAVRAESVSTPISIERADITPVRHSPDAAVSVQDIKCCVADEPAEVHLGVRGPALSDVKIVIMSLEGKSLLVMNPESAQGTPRSLKGEYDYAYSAHFSYPHERFYLMLKGVQNGQGGWQRFRPELFEPISDRD